MLATPGEMAWSAPDGLGRIEVHSAVTEHPAPGQPHVTVTRRLKLEPAVVSALDYPSLLLANRRLQHPQSRIVMFSMR